MKKLLLRTAGLVAGLWAAGTLSAQTVSISTLPPGSVNNVQTSAVNAGVTATIGTIGSQTTVGIASPVPSVALTASPTR